MAGCLYNTFPYGMVGREAAEDILSFDPSARLVVSSGFFNDSVMAEYEKNDFSAAAKPYKLEDIAAASRRRLA
ncbi:MAG: hypothetical protein EG828_09165 [Deltaproteobacteria bacterium]|nr:hypothetical protein [Deltaproteobacteria bacterium]